MTALSSRLMLGLRHVVDVDAHEGPVYFADEEALYFTALPRPGRRVQIKRLALDAERFPLEADRVSVVADACGANGMCAGADGSLLVCEQGSLSHPAQITRLDRLSGARTTVVDHWRGQPFNSPNDVVLAADGAIWFTDPSYGFLQDFRPEPSVGDYVYRHDPSSGETTVVADSFDKPNGIAFSPDEGVLYITDSGANQEPGSLDPARPHHVRAFDVVDGRSLAGERLLAVITPGFPDGLKVDADGRVYVSSFSGVQVLEPNGRWLGEIPAPGAVNFCFGGLDHNLLFITTDSAIWVAELDAKGT